MGGCSEHLCVRLAIVDCAQKQFRGRLPLLPRGLLTSVYDARTVFAASLARQAMLEMFMCDVLDSDECKVLAKIHMASLMRCLWAFCRARTACRELAFKSLQSAMSPYVSSTQASGVESCYDTLVREVLEKAAQENVSLLTRWDAGFQPRNPNLTQNQQAQGKSHPLYGPPVKKLRQSNLCLWAPAAPHASRAGNPRYEAASSMAFHAAGPSRGGGGYRGHQGNQGTGGGAGGRNKHRKKKGGGFKVDLSS